jgi:hypothetical protein
VITNDPTSSIVYNSRERRLVESWKEEESLRQSPKLALYGWICVLILFRLFSKSIFRWSFRSGNIASGRMLDLFIIIKVIGLLTIFGGALYWGICECRRGQRQSKFSLTYGLANKTKLEQNVKPLRLRSKVVAARFLPLKWND